MKLFNILSGGVAAVKAYPVKKTTKISSKANKNLALIAKSELVE